MSYIFPQGQDDGYEVSLTNGVTYRYDKPNNLWQVASVGGGSSDYVRYMPIIGGVFEGPIFGPSVTQLTKGDEYTLTRNANVFDDPTCPPNTIEFHGYVGEELEPGVAAKFKLAIDNADQFVGQKDVQYVLFNDYGMQTLLICEDSGFATDNNKVLNIVANALQGDDFISNTRTVLFSASPQASPYMTLEMYRKLITELDFGAYVSKVGGDEMQGPLHITNNPNAGSSRDARRVETLGVYSGSDSSALRFGTTRDRVYIGHNDTSFNGPIKVDEVHEKNADHGVLFKNTINMDQNKITNLADPENADDAVNLQAVESVVDGLEQKLIGRLDEIIVDNSAGTMRYVNRQQPMSAGEFNTWTANGSQSTNDPSLVRQIWVWETNLSGYPFNWDEVKPNSYFYMSGPSGAMARYRITQVSYVQSSNYYKISVADPDVTPTDYRFSSGDDWEVIFRSFTGGDSNLDDFLRLDGTNKMKGNLDVDGHWVEGCTSLKFDAGTGRNIVVGGNVKIEFDDRTIIKKAPNLGQLGFELDGRTAAGNHNPVFYIYHHEHNEPCSVHYHGQQSEDDHIATVGHVRSAAVTRAGIVDAFSRLQRAVSDEETVEGLRKALTNALGGLIEEFEHGEP